jgi:hypothetical protein
MITDFPEDIFIAKKKPIYSYKVDSGKKILLNKTILFCGICRNVADVIERNILCMQRTGSMFKDYSIFLYENDSTDNTVEILNRYKSEKFNFISESRKDKNYRDDLLNGNDPWHFARCKVLSDCRNVYLDYAKKIDYDYLCVLDLDLKGGWSYDGVAHGIFTLEFNKKIAAVTAYGVLSDPDNMQSLEDVNKEDYIMYDSFAFRPKNVMNGIHMLRTPLFNKPTFNRGEDPINVKSNFGGMAIYKKSIIDKYKYYAKQWLDGFVDPDHVCIHKDMIKDDWEIVLDPSMIVSYSDHKYSKVSND